MLKVVFTLLALINSSNGSILGDNHNYFPSPEEIISEIVVSESFSNSESRSEGCDDTESHCIHHCAGQHNPLFMTANQSVNSASFQIMYKIWKPRFLYKSLVLDPAFKPPLFS